MTHPPAPLRWLRLAAIAIGVLILASCRALPERDSPAARVGPVMTRAPSAPPAILQVGYDAEYPITQEVGPEAGQAVVSARQPAPCGPRGCGPAACPPAAVAPCAPPPPVVGPWFVCDGGDGGAPARPIGDAGLANLTAGDTVARYRPADDGPDHECVQLATTNCACVYAPRFAAVREVVRLAEDRAEQGPNGLALDRLVSQQVDLLPVQDKTQQVMVVGARRALPGVALEERLGPLAVDQAEELAADQGRERAAADVALLQPEGARLAQSPRLKVGFVVPVAWTCVKAANVLVAGQEAQVVATDRGTATLRFESPGRAELTLCKRAGTDTARPGEELDFLIYFLNSGDRPLTDIVLADALPTRLELVPGSAACSVPADISTAAGDDGSVVLTWRLSETLRPGESGFVRFRALVR